MSDELSTIPSEHHTALKALKAHADAGKFNWLQLLQILSQLQQSNPNLIPQVIAFIQQLLGGQTPPAPKP